MTDTTPASTCNPCRDTPAAATPTPPAPDDGPVIVLGIGNVLWADEGFGVRAVEALQRQWTFADGGHPVELVDGGTQGLYLIQHVQAASRLLILDAIDYGLAPGTLHLVENDEVPKFLGAKKMSLHTPARTLGPGPCSSSRRDTTHESMILPTAARQMRR